MSYIRTKDKIYKVKTENEFTYDTTTGENIFKSDVIKEKDDIEDLCDEFVLTDETLSSHLDTNVKEIKMYKKYIAGSRGDIFGAIWTSKGLIYVAKVNDKGELELI